MTLSAVFPITRTPRKDIAGVYRFEAIHPGGSTYLDTYTRWGHNGAESWRSESWRAWVGWLRDADAIEGQWETDVPGGFNRRDRGILHGCFLSRTDIDLAPGTPLTLWVRRKKNGKWSAWYADHA